MYANEREVAQWIRYELGWAYLADQNGECIVEVEGSDAGDDTPGRWWAEIRVRPDVHERLLQQFSLDTPSTH
jgi:hypothetical protein